MRMNSKLRLEIRGKRKKISFGGSFFVVVNGDGFYCHCEEDEPSVGRRGNLVSVRGE